MTEATKQSLTAIAIRLSRADAITPDDVIALRGATYDDAHISVSEAETLLALAGKVSSTCAEWDQYLVEALADFTVNQAEPRGYISPENADWLEAQILKDGVVCDTVELKLLVGIIERAAMVPEKLVKLALEAVRDAIIVPARAAAPAEMPAVRVTEERVEQLRQIIFAAGGPGQAAISRCEAEILFEINDATDPQMNCEAWNDLFVKAIANNLMAFKGFAVPNRDVAMRREDWLDDNSPSSVSGMLGAAISLKGIWQAYTGQSVEEQNLARLERQRREILLDEAVTEEEGNWVIDRIRQDGMMCDNERALLQFLKDESPDLFPEIDDVLAEAA